MQFHDNEANLVSQMLPSLRKQNKRERAPFCPWRHIHPLLVVQAAYFQILLIMSAEFWFPGKVLLTETLHIEEEQGSCSHRLLTHYELITAFSLSSVYDSILSRNNDLLIVSDRALDTHWVGKDCAQ